MADETKSGFDYNRLLDNFFKAATPAIYKVTGVTDAQAEMAERSRLGLAGPSDLDLFLRDYGKESLEKRLNPATDAPTSIVSSSSLPFIAIGGVLLVVVVMLLRK